ncbi:MAG TPA: ABC transporter permease [Candidatus Acidoferrales bacterium]|nr:ABC transporter permease [Candidatus Acidoferrales bacterium]
MKKLLIYLPAFLLLLLLLVAWEAIVDLFNINPQVLPAPSAIVSVFADHAVILVPHILTTLLETLLGLLFAVIFGVFVAILLRLSSLVRKALYPLLIISQTIPIIALAPLLLIWFGFTILPKVIIVTMVCFFPITVAFADGMEKVSPQIITLLQSMKATRLQILFIAELPGALPSFFSGLRIASAYSVTGAIVGEYVGGYQGLGIYMQNAAHSYAVNLVFVVIIITSLLSIFLFAAVVLLEKILIPWNRGK